MKKSDSRTTLTLLIIVWIILAFLLESSDLWISVNVFDPNQLWAIIIEKYGELPGLLVVIIAFHIYLVTLKSSSNIKIILLSTLLLLAGTISTIYFILALIKGITNSYDLFTSYKNYIYLSAVILNILISFLLRKKQKFTPKVKLFAKVTSGTFFYGYLLFVQPLKMFWGRIRFRDLASDYSNFSPWYLPQGLNGNDSFPSGHAAMSWILITLFVLVSDRSLLKRIIVKGLIISWALTVIISRVVIGAHYASDVLFGSMIVIVAYMLVIKTVTKTRNDV